MGKENDPFVLYVFVTEHFLRIEKLDGCHSFNCLDLLMVRMCRSGYTGYFYFCLMASKKDHLRMMMELLVQQVYQVSFFP